MKTKTLGLFLAIAIVITGNIVGGGASCDTIDNAPEICPEPGKIIEAGADPPEMWPEWA